MLYLIGALNFIRAHWRLLAPLALAAIVLGLLAYARHEHTVATAAKAAARDATKQANLNAKVGQITESTLRSEAHTRDIADEEVAHVQALPEAQTPIPAQRRDALCHALGRVYDKPVCVDHGPADPS